MKNTLLMGIDTPFDLNLLIYIQNIYLNQNNYKENLKFPYVSKRIAFKDSFETAYSELWHDVFQFVLDNDQNGAIPFYKDKDSFYKRLLMDGENSLEDFNEIYKTFEVWWNSFAGYFAIERSIDEMGQQLYAELANLLVQRGIKPQKQLNICLIYDECLLADMYISSYFAVVPIRDFFIKSKELVSRLETCIV